MENTITLRQQCSDQEQKKKKTEMISDKARGEEKNGF